MVLFSDPDGLARRIQEAWDGSIPLARQMGVRLVRLDEEGLLASAPLGLNHNHLGTAFGGSVHNLATLASWGLVLAMLDAPDRTDLVIQESRVRYLTPITGDFEAHCAIPDAPGPQRFRRAFATRGRARITVHAAVRQTQAIAAEFTGVFAALRQN